MVVPSSQPIVEGLFGLSQTAKNGATDHFVGDESKPTLHVIKPGTAGRREMKVEAAALFGLAPSLGRRAFVQRCSYPE